MYYPQETCHSPLTGFVLDQHRMRCLSNAVLMLGQRRRRWTNIKTALDKHVLLVDLHTIE